RPAPAGRSGPSSHQHTRRRLTFAITDWGLQLVASGLVTGMADVDLIEGEQHLAVIGTGFDHGATLGEATGCNCRREEGAGGGWWVRHQHPGVTPRFGVDAHDRLAVQVLRHIGDEAVLPDDHHHVLSAEDEAVEITALHLSPTPLFRN